MAHQRQKIIVDPNIASYDGVSVRANAPFANAPYLPGRASSGKERKSTSGFPPRDLRLDLFRGISLLLIFIDHIPDNFLAYFTLKSVTFSDAAEIFYFISGYVAALVYGRAMDQHGIFAATLRVYKRVWTLFIAHIVLFMVFVAEVSFSVNNSGHWIYNSQLRVDDFLAEPGTAMFKALTLQFQPVYLDILPLYILFLLVFPLVLKGFSRNAFLVMIPSALIYGGVQMWDWNLSSYPEGHTWYFDPLAWQFLFLLGSYCGFTKLRGRRILPHSPWVLVGAGLVLLCAGAVQLTAMLHGIWDTIPSLISAVVPADKTTLAPIRIVNFLALAMIAAWAIPENARILTTKISWWVIRCGQHSLHVFCFSIIIAVIAQILQQEVDGGMMVQLALNAAGLSGIVAFGTLMSWLTHEGKLPQPPQLAA